MGVSVPVIAMRDVCSSMLVDDVGLSSVCVCGERDMLLLNLDKVIIITINQCNIFQALKI